VLHKGESDASALLSWLRTQKVGSSA
jgi:hypothetical protein